MFFELTDNLKDKIIEALENQDEEFILDTKNVIILNKKSVNSISEDLYDLPEWNSKKGYDLRQDFVNTLRAPLARDKLQKILHSGRGVFKGFKITIKEFPEVEKLWHLYKNNKMQLYIDNWYNDLRELWGLEKLSIEPEDIEELILDDFIFQEYKSRSDANFIAEYIKQFLSCSTLLDFYNDECDWAHQINDAVYQLWHQQFLRGESLGQTGFICKTLSNDFAGCITTAPVSEKNKNFVTITSYFVPENYQGLGIGTKLLSKCLSHLKSLGIKGILLAYTIVPESVQTLLLHSGFEKTGSGFLAKL